MISDVSLGQKVSARHLSRNAYLYVRQSSLRQVFENQESTKRQYGLRERAVALGWPLERVVVIDQDQGQSGASTDREGFARLVAEVGMGRAGIVLGLEVSRLARNSSDWHRLLEICAVTDTLILDEDGIYDPAHFNDRLLLGLKGTMSEAELHVLRARLRGGILNKARRGELPSRLPIGFVYDPAGRVVLEPDQQVRDSLHALFATFRRTGSAMATVKAFRTEGLKFPRHACHGPRHGEVLWGELGHSRALWILHNPRFAGAFFFGRTRQRRGPEGMGRWAKLPREEWLALVHDAHAGYITWADFEENERRLLENAAAVAAEHAKSPPREGPALLQGLVLCGRCGQKMTVRYHVRQARVYPEYTCQRRGIEHGLPKCQAIPGAGIDRAVGELLVEAVSPLALEVTLAVQAELDNRLGEADTLRRTQVERYRYEADLAQRRYLKVDPENRLVADALEADWNQKLRDLSAAQEEYERQREADRTVLTTEQRERILALGSEFPKVWADPATPDRERKRMLRLLIEDVTLIKEHQITAHVRFRGGATRTLTIPVPLSAWQIRKTCPELVTEVDRLLESHTDAEVAHLLDERGLQSGVGRRVSVTIIRHLRKAYGLKTRGERLRAVGFLTQKEIARELGVSTSTVKLWRGAGLLEAQVHNDKGECLYAPLGANPPKKQQGHPRLDRRPPFRTLLSDQPDEVQYEGLGEHLKSGQSGADQIRPVARCSGRSVVYSMVG